MLRKRWFRWLSPGLNIKRWLALFSCGVGLLIIGISLMFNYQWLAVLEDIVLAFSYNMTGFYNYNVLIAVGVVVGAAIYGGITIKTKFADEFLGDIPEKIRRKVGFLR